MQTELYLWECGHVSGIGLLLESAKDPAPDESRPGHVPACQPEYAAIIPEKKQTERPVDVLIAVTEQTQETAVIPAAVCK